MIDPSPEQDLPAGPTGAMGRIVSVTGARAIVMLAEDHDGAPGIRAPEIGSLLKFDIEATVFGIVTALRANDVTPTGNMSEHRLVEIEFVGEIAPGASHSDRAFRRGVSVYPTLGDAATPASAHDIAQVYNRHSDTAIRIGTISKAPSVPAMVEIDDLLGKHVAILGATGTGKSCATALLLRRIVEKAPFAHIILLDPHNEYAAAFGDLAEIITPETFQLPFWLLDFDELTEVLIGSVDEHPAEIEILRELIPQARLRFGSNQRRDRLLIRNMATDPHQSTISINTPIPYRISDLIALLDETMGRLELKGGLAPYKRLRARIEFITRDPRFSFMFGSLTVQDNMAGVLGQLFRIPVAGKPIALVELGGLPSEVLDVVVSVLARLSFDFATWGGGNTPIAIICEEAHRFAPADSRQGFEPTRRALSRIAREGRKYGLSLVVVSQRPSELDPTLLSQCSTIFALRLTNERDQQIVRAAVNDTTNGLLSFLPSMGAGEAAIFGEGTALPARIRFDPLPETQCPRNSSAIFSTRWSSEQTVRDDLEDLVQRWRSHGRAELSNQSLTPQLARVLANAEGVSLPSRRRAEEHLKQTAAQGDERPVTVDDVEWTTPQAKASPPAVGHPPSSLSPAPELPNNPPQQAPSASAIDWRSLRMKIIASAATGIDRKTDTGN